MGSDGRGSMRAESRIGGAVVAMVIVAEGARVAAGRPRGASGGAAAGRRARLLRAPPSSSAREDYRDGQRLLIFAGLAIELSGRRRWSRSGAPAPVRRAASSASASGRSSGPPRPGRRRRRTIALVATLPSEHRRPRARGRRRPLDPVARPLAGTSPARPAITAVLIAGPARRSCSRSCAASRAGWWLPAAAGVVAIAVVFTWLAPVVLAPLFNRFEPLPEGSERAGRGARARAARPGSTSARSTGSTPAAASTCAQRLRRRPRPDQAGRPLRQPDRRRRARRSCARSSRTSSATSAHDDIPRGHRLRRDRRPARARSSSASSPGRSPTRRGRARLAGGAPGLPLAIAVVSLVLNVPGNQLSREVEASADDFALELTDDPQALIDLQRRLTTENVSDPDPPGCSTFLFGRTRRRSSESARRSPTSASGETSAPRADSNARRELEAGSRSGAPAQLGACARAESIAIRCTSPGALRAISRLEGLVAQRGDRAAQLEHAGLDPGADVEGPCRLALGRRRGMPRRRPRRRRSRASARRRRRPSGFRRRAARRRRSPRRRPRRGGPGAARRRSRGEAKRVRGRRGASRGRGSPRRRASTGRRGRRGARLGVSRAAARGPPPRRRSRRRWRRTGSAAVGGTGGSSRLIVPADVQREVVARGRRPSGGRRSGRPGGRPARGVPRRRRWVDEPRARRRRPRSARRRRRARPPGSRAGPRRGRRHHHLVAAGDERVHEVRADEAGAACDQSPHHGAQLRRLGHSYRRRARLETRSAPTSSDAALARAAGGPRTAPCRATG